ncbi:hypothetical protein PtA15_1A316 [Puccinia triticina]|uniref:Uncharacterized protein n=1 Tax=Puccinia triticina TaxID=208348 RepID=A0ABY7C733_9BASI|nr:uncharacterized protein PtA15_1A316 [Puccinia triticina]WAQ80978.1 hypothetical protein PtA15_1A316 [Puccinia triticina]
MAPISRTASSSNSRRATAAAASRIDSENDTLNKILAASEEEHRRHQAELARREAEELERVRIESEAAAKLERTRTSLLEQAEQAQLELVIQHSQAIQHASSHGPFSPQNEHEERMAFELAVALSLHPDNARSAGQQQPEEVDPPSYENSFHGPHPHPASPASPRPQSIFTRPLPPIPSQQPPSSIIVRPPSASPGHPHLPASLIQEPDPFSDQFATHDPDPPAASPASSSRSSLLLPPLSEPASQTSSASHLSPPPGEPQPKEHGPIASPGAAPSDTDGQGTLALTIPCPSLPLPLLTASPVGASEDGAAINRPAADSSSESFDANPSPPESVAEGITYGQVRAIDQPLTSAGQFVDTLVLSNFSDPVDRTKASSHALVAIEAWSWNRLLTYLMWHGNSQIEPGPLDVSEAEDAGTGSWQMGMSVIFREPEGVRPSVRLVMELIAGTGESQWSRAEGCSVVGGRSRRRSSTVLTRRTSTDAGRLPAGPVQTTIHLPKPFPILPVSLAGLACTLHEMHTVARMSSCGSLRPSSTTTSTTSSASSLSKQALPSGPSNQEIFARLAKAVAANARLLGEEEESRLQAEERLFKRGKRWLKRTTHNHGRLVLTVDGEGLPLPTGATLVRPWESDWN